ncbi:uncharacterized protein LOC128274426 [Anopheles cruzii]|uniref:uncharacterized protein LOC128274426 n=1 Tax=Anopheles cruzii TaxID=68878 RepID=UPI0022EC794D|nr:uncharacterized protein LOC128274426 [Anopheles cruzii]
MTEQVRKEKQAEQRFDDLCDDDDDLMRPGSSNLKKSEQQRLEKFIMAFVQKFEEELKKFREQDAVGGTPRSGGTRSIVAAGGAGAGAAIGFASGIPGAAAGGSKLGGAIGALYDFFRGKSDKRKASRIIEVFEQIEEDSIRSTLLEVGFDIFFSFESQFTTVTDANGLLKRGMEKLAIDAVYRAINYIDGYTKKSEYIENLCHLITKGVILGKSENGFVAPLFRFFQVDKLIKGHNIPEWQKRFIRNPGHTVKNKEEKWKSADLYEGVGLVIIKDNGVCNKYYKKIDGGNAEKYGYRLPFEWDDMENYIEEDRPSEEYRYTLKSGKLTQELDRILQKINGPPSWPNAIVDVTFASPSVAGPGNWHVSPKYTQSDHAAISRNPTAQADAHGGPRKVEAGGEDQALCRETV